MVSSTGSTNADVLAVVDGDAVSGEPMWPHLSALASLDQRSGRGRRGRIWATDPGAALAVSVVLRPHEFGMPREAYGRIPLVVGLAVRDVIMELISDTPSLKWPNDVLVGGRKIAGILCEVSPAGAVVAGIGLNLLDSATAFASSGVDPVVATSLAAQGAGNVGARQVLVALGDAMRRRTDDLFGASGSLDASGLREEYQRVCSTIGAEVRLEQPGGEVVAGRCVGIDSDGRLLLSSRDSSSVGDSISAFSSGDVVHVR